MCVRGWAQHTHSLISKLVLIWFAFSKVNIVNAKDFPSNATKTTVRGKSTWPVSDSGNYDMSNEAAILASKFSQKPFALQMNILFVRIVAGIKSNNAKWCKCFLYFEYLRWKSANPMQIFILVQNKKDNNHKLINSHQAENCYKIEHQSWHIFPFCFPFSTQTHLLVRSLTCRRCVYLKFYDVRSMEFVCAVAGGCLAV